MNQWTYDSVNQRANESKSQCANEIWIDESVNPWINEPEPMNDWISEPVSQWTNESVTKRRNECMTGRMAGWGSYFSLLNYFFFTEPPPRWSTSSLSYFFSEHPMICSFCNPILLAQLHCVWQLLSSAMVAESFKTTFCAAVSIQFATSNCSPAMFRSASASH